MKEMAELVSRLEKLQRSGLASFELGTFGDRSTDPADRNQRTRSYGPRRGASKEAIEQAEKRIGRALPSSYRAFLEQSNGWHGFLGDDELFPIEAVAAKGTYDPYDVVSSFQDCCDNDDLLDVGIVIGGGSSDVFVLVPDGDPGSEMQLVRFSYRSESETLDSFTELIELAVDEAKMAAGEE